jgi:hypothetical protein
MQVPRSTRCPTFPGHTVLQPGPSWLNAFDPTDAPGPLASSVDDHE